MSKLRVPDHDFESDGRKAYRAVNWILAGAILFCVAAWLVVFFLTMTEARAHEAPPTLAMPFGWTFDGFCCQGNAVEGDCDEIPLTAIAPVQGGVSVTLRPGEHRLVTTPQSYSMPQEDIRNSPDGHAYACLFPSQTELRCLYLPPPGV